MPTVIHAGAESGTSLSTSEKTPKSLSLGDRKSLDIGPIHATADANRYPFESLPFEIHISRKVPTPPPTRMVADLEAAFAYTGESGNSSSCPLDGSREPEAQDPSTYFIAGRRLRGNGMV
jgi:hypothetical protein